MSIEEIYKLYLECDCQIMTDSRKVIKGSLFIALSGENFNGNRFAQDALNAGARYAIIDDVKCQTERTYLVDDTLKVLQELSTFHRHQVSPKVIALTGTNGKTTTKELIASVLQTRFKIHFTKGNFNNQIGVPLTLLNMPYDTEMAVIEMGASEEKEIKKLCEIADPDYGLVTNIGQAHIEGFGSFEGVKRAKLEMYDYIRNQNKVLFVNKADEVLFKESQLDNCVYYHDCIDLQINDELHFELVKETPFIQFKTGLREGDHSAESKLFGRYNFINIMAAVTIGHYFGISIKVCLEGIEKYIPDNNRSQLVKINSNTVILDAYNANPSSMQLALKSINTFDLDCKWVILGDMKELGSIESAAHQELVDSIKLMNFEKTILVGSVFSNCELGQFESFIDVNTLKEKYKITDLKDKLIFIKGSRSMQLEQFIKE